MLLVTTGVGCTALTSHSRPAPTSAKALSADGASEDIRRVDPDSLETVPLDEWKPDRTISLNPALVSADMKITGRWHFFDGRFFGTDISIDADESLFPVHFHAWGCAGAFSLERNATFEGGVVHLDKPVRDFWPNTYQDLFAAHVHGKDYLVPECIAKEFEAWAFAPRPSSAILHALQRRD